MLIHSFQVASYIITIAIKTWVCLQKKLWLFHCAFFSFVAHRKFITHAHLRYTHQQLPIVNTYLENRIEKWTTISHRDFKQRLWSIYINPSKNNYVYYCTLNWLNYVRRKYEFFRMYVQCSYVFCRLQSVRQVAWRSSGLPLFSRRESWPGHVALQFNNPQHMPKYLSL